MSSQVQDVIDDVLGGVQKLDDDIFQYISSMVADTEAHGCDPETLQETVGPFLQSSGFCNTDEEVEQKSQELALRLQKALGMGTHTQHHKEMDQQYDGKPRLLDAPVTMKELVDNDKSTLDFMWGTDKVRAQFNQLLDNDMTLSKKDIRKMEKEQIAFLEEMERLTGTVEDDGEDDISMMVLPDYSSGHNEKDIHVHNFGLSLGGLELLEGADLKLSYGRKYGLIGRNGVGKTTLLRHMAAYDIEGFPKHHRVLHVRQEIKASDKSVLQVVLDSDVERSRLIQEDKDIQERQAQRADNPPPPPGDPIAEEEAAAAAKDAQRLTEINDRLLQIGANSAEARAAMILSGLGFTTQMSDGPTNALSGGWRMRVAIAGALFIEPDLLMLDEPTNHLDVETVVWLEQYLKNYPKTLLLVSHDRTFLNEVTTDIIFFHNKKLNYYKGNYNTFETVKSELQKNQKRAYEAQKAKKEHMQEFIDKFRYNAKRASLVQSRIKALEKMDDVEDIEEERAFEFTLPEPGPLGRPVIQIDDVSFGYDAKHSLLLHDVNFGVDLESRIAMVGPNGAGKSTLLNLILGKLKAVSGYVHRNGNLKIAHFTQHHAEQFDYRLNPLDNMLKMFPGVQDQDMRNFLGKFWINGPLALRPMKFLSGGQKSRVAFAALAYSKPHVVIMDEPTNHLDTTTIDALIGAIKEFKGGVIVVSHDQHFLTQVCEELWVVGKGKVLKYNGTFDDYKKDVIDGKNK